MIWIRFLAPFLPYIVSALVMGGAYLWADNGWHNNVAQRAEKRATTAEAKLAQLDRERIAQQERHLQLTAAEELRQRTQDAKRKKQYSPTGRSCCDGWTDPAQDAG